MSSDFEVPYTYNDLGSVKAALEGADGDCAAIFVGGASYPYSGATEMATPEFARGLRKLADEYGAMLVLDEIRTNFRVGPSVEGGHWAALGAAGGDGLDVAPDMQCLCKALANGHPLSALVGNERARDGASIITASGTFWLSGGPMAAAMATLDILQADGSAAMAHMQSMGSMLTDGIEEQAARHGVPVSVSGPPAMPFVTFDADDAVPAERPLAHAWCTVVAEEVSNPHLIRVILTQSAPIPHTPHRLFLTYSSPHLGVGELGAPAPQLVPEPQPHAGGDLADARATEKAFAAVAGK